MKLIIGGRSQGKLQYAMGKYGVKDWVLADGSLPEAGEKVMIDHFHLWVRQTMEQGECPEEQIKKYVEEHPECIIISDEIGSGLVPVDPFEREYRERTGRILVELAKEAEEVERVICGIGMKIK